MARRRLLQRPQLLTGIYRDGMRRIVALLVVVLGALPACARPGPAEPAEPLPPASPGVVSADYRDVHWRLTAVTDRDGTRQIPAALDSWLELATDGELLASDGVNVVNARFAAAPPGFGVSGAMTTLVAYGGDDPAQLAAVTAISAMTAGPPLESPSPVAEPRPVPVTVVAATPTTLTLQAGGVQLTFTRTGPATHTNATPIPDASSAPTR